MMYYEFLYIAEVSEREITEKEYKDYIEPLYVDDPEELDKFQWCARYGKGLVAAFPYIRSLVQANYMLDTENCKLKKKNRELTERVTDLSMSAEESWTAYQNVIKGRTEARQKVGELSDKIERIKAILN